jgi:hypothetical protein
VVDQTGTAGQSDYFMHTGLNNGTTYYYAAFAHDAVPNYASGVTTSGTPIAPPAGSGPGVPNIPYPSGKLFQIIGTIHFSHATRTESFQAAVVRNRSGDKARTPMKTDTLFRIASMSKSFTALAILQLRDAGKLNLDDSASKYISEMKKLRYLTTDAPEITIRDLMTHGAAFREYGQPLGHIRRLRIERFLLLLTPVCS